MDPGVVLVCLYTKSAFSSLSAAQRKYGPAIMINRKPIALPEFSGKIKKGLITLVTRHRTSLSTKKHALCSYLYFKPISGILQAA
jgi:hypothetical protein